MSEAAHETVITGIGLASSMGGVIPACAAARAGLTRVSDAAAAVDGASPLTQHRCPALEGFSGPSRLALLAAQALADLAQGGPGFTAHDTAFFLNLPSPEDRPGWTANAEAADLGDELVTLLNGLSPQPVPRPTLLIKGHAGVLIAVAQAHHTLHSGSVNRCLVGGIDSLLDNATLALFHERDVLKSEDQSAGLVPGEGAVFVLLERAQDARARGTPILATLLAAEQGLEEYRYEDPNLVPTGIGLARVLTAVRDRVTDLDATTLVSDLNGVDVRAREWGFAWLKCLHHHPSFGALELALPAISFGDTGAAAGGFGLCVALRALARGYAGGRDVLVCAGSDAGSRAAVALRKGSR